MVKKSPAKRIAKLEGQVIGMGFLLAKLQQAYGHDFGHGMARKSSASHSHPMTAYKCTACGWWHLGQPAKKPKRLPVVRKNNHQVRFA